MSIRAWRWPQLLLFWAAALGVALLLIRIQFHLLGDHFFWLLPYSGTFASGVRSVATVWRSAPLLVLGLLVVPGLACLVTAYWAAGHLAGGSQPVASNVRCS